MRCNPVVPLHLLVPLEGPLTFKVSANLRPIVEETAAKPDHMVCKNCGTRDDAFGCYETCTFNGPLHEWIEPPLVNETDEELKTRIRAHLATLNDTVGIDLAHPDYCSRCDGACRGHE